MVAQNTSTNFKYGARGLLHSLAMQHNKPPECGTNLGKWGKTPVNWVKSPGNCVKSPGNTVKTREIPSLLC